MANITADLCIIGAGSGGLSLAAGASQLGLETVLIEKHKMGGDCLNTGCVPSKALIAAAKRAHTYELTDIKGVSTSKPVIDYAKVKEHVSDTIKTIEPNDSVERFESLGVNVIQAAGEFISEDEVKAGEHNIKAKNFVICTGSKAFVPPIPGLEEDKILTNENIFDLKEKPEHLLIVGGGPIGIEMAQSHMRLGCKVTVLDRGKLFPRDDADNAAILKKIILDEGLNLLEEVNVVGLKHASKEVTVEYEEDGKKKTVSGSHILISSGRAPNIEGLELEKAGVEYGKRGIKVNASLKTSNKNIFAIGDVAGGPQFTHVAGYHAGIIVRQICFKLFWSKTDYSALPWVTYTQPELAQVGLTEEAAKKEHGSSIKVSKWTFDENDRAIAEKKTAGQVKVVANSKGRVLGASIVGDGAGELLQIWSLAISKKLKVSDVAGTIAPYPTRSEVNKRAASAWYTKKLFSESTKKTVSLLRKLPF